VRCPSCHTEIDEGRCDGCGIEFSDAGGEDEIDELEDMFNGDDDMLHDPDFMRGMDMEFHFVAQRRREEMRMLREAAEAEDHRFAPQGARDVYDMVDVQAEMSEEDDDEDDLMGQDGSEEGYEDSFIDDGSEGEGREDEVVEGVMSESEDEEVPRRRSRETRAAKKERRSERQSRRAKRDEEVVSASGSDSKSAPASDRESEDEAEGPRKIKTIFQLREARLKALEQ
jgi:hypothetical protein